MRIAILIDFEDGTGHFRREAYIPERTRDGVVIQPTPDLLWYNVIKTARILIRQWAWAKHARPEVRSVWAPLARVWDEPIAKMIAAVKREESKNGV